MEKICKNCEHWFVESSEEDQNFGKCTNLKLLDSFSEETDVMLLSRQPITGKDFGCNQFSEIKTN